MACYSQSLRVTNCIKQDRKAEQELYHKVSDLSHILPLALFEGSRRKEDFHKALKEADELLDLVGTFKDASDESKSPQIRYSIKLLNNLLLMSISYHCRIFSDSFSLIGAIHSNSVHQNRIRENEVETGYLVMKDMANTLLSVYQQFNVVERHLLTTDDLEEMLGLLLQSILRLNALRIRTPEMVGNSEYGSAKWPRRCWNELGCPLMKIASSITESKESDAKGCASKCRISTSFLFNVLSSLTDTSHEDGETRCSREKLLVQLEQRVSSLAFNPMGNQSQETHEFKGATLRKRSACDKTISYNEIDHCSHDNINTVLEQFFGLTFPTVDSFWSNDAEADGTEEIEQTLMEIKSRSQLQELISMLLRRILTHHPSNGDMNDDLNVTRLPGIVQMSREAVRILLPIVYVLLTKAHMAMIPRDELISICKTLMLTAHDNEVVNRTIEVTSRLLAQIAQTNCEGNESGIHHFVGLIDCISHVVSIHPLPSFHILENMLSAFRQMSISFSHDEHLWLQLTRKPHALSAIVRATTWQSLHVPVIQILWTLSNNPGNQRCVARHPGVLASMIRIARENPIEETSALQPSGITMEAWKGRIMKLADAL